MHRLRLAISLALVFCFATAGPAFADEVGRLIQLAKKKPRGMNADDWRVKRRDAVKKLGNLGDKRAVDVLITIVRSEEFDVVAENAVVALGKLGDKKAVPALEGVANDGSRDRYIRKLARQALAKLGAKASGKPKKTEPTTTSPTLVGNGGGGGDSGPLTIPTGPTFGDDVLSATERLRFAVGSARVEFDSLRDRPSITGTVVGSYERTVQTQKRAWRYAIDASVDGGIVDFDGPGTQSQVLNFNSLIGGDVRFFLGEAPYYVMGEGAIGSGFTRLRTLPMGVTQNINRGSADGHLGARIGYGRIFDRGEALRLRRIETMLREAKALGRPITADLAARIQRTWWALRGERGYSRRLRATVKLLREAGVLLGEPDAFVTYKMLQVLSDGQLNHRLDGWDANLGVTVSALVRDNDQGLEEGFIQNAVVQARYGKQNKSGTQELVGALFGRHRFGAEDGEDTPYALGATAAWRNYRYADTYDPIGALEIGVGASLAEDGNDQTNRALRLEGSIGWMWIPSRATNFRLAAHLAVEAGEIFIGATFEASYGFLDVGYLGRNAY